MTTPRAALAAMLRALPDEELLALAADRLQAEEPAPAPPPEPTRPRRPRTPTHEALRALTQEFRRTRAEHRELRRIFDHALAALTDRAEAAEARARAAEEALLALRPAAPPAAPPEPPIEPAEAPCGCPLRGGPREVCADLRGYGGSLCGCGCHPEPPPAPPATTRDEPEDDIEACVAAWDEAWDESAPPEPEEHVLGLDVAVPDPEPAEVLPLEPPAFQPLPIVAEACDAINSDDDEQLSDAEVEEKLKAWDTEDGDAGASSSWDPDPPAEDDDPADPPRAARQRAPRRTRRDPEQQRAHTESVREMKRHLRVLPPTEEIPAERPRTRGECASGPRPCPWVSCQHHLFLDIDPHNGSLKFNFPETELEELPATCALDIADKGGVMLEDVAAAMNITRERVRQIEARAMDRMARRPTARRIATDLGLAP